MDYKWIGKKHSEKTTDKKEIIESILRCYLRTENR